MALRAPASRIVHSIAAAASIAWAASAAAVQAEYRWNLATFSGVVRSDGVVLRFDPQENELYAIDQGVVRIFGKTGMQIHAFGEDRRLFPVQDLAALDDGDLLVLGAGRITRCNYRGEPKAEWRLRDAPADAKGFVPESIRAVNGRVFLANLAVKRVIVADEDGAYVRSHDLAVLLKPFATVDLRRRRVTGTPAVPREVEPRGFGVGPDESLLLTEPTGFRAFVISPGGEVRTFGQRGGAPGMFNVAVAIDADEQGNLYVVDILKSAVMVFDKEFNFLREFGYRGGRPGNLVAPVQVAAGGGQAFVSQMGRRGVAVYRVQQDAKTGDESKQGQE
jgi:hypothetical protein